MAEVKLRLIFLSQGTLPWRCKWVSQIGATKKLLIIKIGNQSLISKCGLSLPCTPDLKTGTKTTIKIIFWMSCDWINLSCQQFDYIVIGLGSPALCDYQRIVQISMSWCINPKCPFCFMSTVKLPSHVGYFDHANRTGHTIAGVATSFFLFFLCKARDLYI